MSKHIQMTPQTKALLLENLLLDGYLLLQQIQDLKCNLSVELQAVRDDRKAQSEEFREFMVELTNSLDQIRGKHLIQAQLLDLVQPDRKNSDHATH